MKQITVIPFLFFFLPLVSQPVTFKLTVTTPAETPKSDIIYIAGSHRLLGGWNPSKAALTRQNDSTWTFSAEFDRSDVLDFKLTRGSFESEAIYEKGKIPPNTVVRLSESAEVTLRPVSWKDFSGLKQKTTGQITGTVAYHRDLSWPSLHYKRDLIVWLPPSYSAQPNKRYPVLYMLDGQNIIDPKTSSFGKDWQVDEEMTELISSGKIEEAIIVGIYNSPDRTAEYSDSPLGKAFAEFVVRSVKPLIDKTYRTKPEAEFTSMMGSSMGGLSAFLFVWWYPDIFSQAGCISSAFIEPFDDILAEVEKYSGSKKKIRVYLDDGGVGLELRLKPGYDKMIAVLEKKGYIKGTDLDYFYDEAADHSEGSWANRVWRPLTFFYGKK